MRRLERFEIPPTIRLVASSNCNFGRAVLSQLFSARPFLPGRYLLRQ
jgi:hypothetical protein